MNAEELRAVLFRELGAVHAAVTDESRRHAGHANGGGGRFRIEVTAPYFSGKSPMERHRLV